MPLRIAETSAGVELALKVVPGASRSKVAGVLGDSLKLAVSAPPADGAANRAVIELLADTFGVAERSVAIVSGHTNPRKRAQIAGITREQAIARLTALGFVG